VRDNYLGGHYEVPQQLAERMGFQESILHSVGQIYERWDGKGVSNHLPAEAVDTAVLLATLAQDAVTFPGALGSAGDTVMGQPLACVRDVGSGLRKRRALTGGDAEEPP
jgi:hypothetical protein